MDIRAAAMTRLAWEIFGVFHIKQVLKEAGFVLIYLLCILAVGLPIMMAEIMIGRRARKSPVNAKTAALDLGQTSKWQAVG